MPSNPKPTVHVWHNSTCRQSSLCHSLIMSCFTGLRRRSFKLHILVLDPFIIASHQPTNQLGMGCDTNKNVYGVVKIWKENSIRIRRLEIDKSFPYRNLKFNVSPRNWMLMSQMKIKRKLFPCFWIQNPLPFKSNSLIFTTYSTNIHHIFLSNQVKRFDLAHHSILATG